jgi:predicted DNA-binding antitoxin AbrB/MazE fold protein
MTITIEATYENGVLKPMTPLPLKENDRVVLTLNSPTPSAADQQAAVDWVRRTSGIVTGCNKEAVHYFAMDKDLEYDTRAEE